jgi:K+-transporting ATPase ATPase C chain
MLRRQLVTGLIMTVALIVLLGVAYPLVVTGVSQVLFSSRANGSYTKDASGRVVGSSLIGQNFTLKNGDPDPRYFQPRPSAGNYDGLASGGSNLGPSNPKLLAEVRQRVAAYRQLNGLAADAVVPVDAVTASASGLDPGISVANARLQAPRVARERGLSTSTVLALVDKHTERRQWGFLGERAVNVLRLNLALDQLRR